MKLSELYGMQVEKINSKRRGYVLKAFAEGDKISHIVCSDADENEFCVAAKDILSANNCIIYRNESRFMRKNRALRLGAPCFNERGKILGVIKDYTLNGLTIKSVQIGEKSYSYSRVIAGDAVIIKDKAKPDVSASLVVRDMFINATLS